MPSRKGSPNRIGAGVKSNVVAVFEKIGGRDAMAKWAEENLTEFYRLYARLIPSESFTEINFRDVRELDRSELLLIASGSREGVAGEGSGDSELCEVH